jgi:hypothetical protein
MGHSWPCEAVSDIDSGTRYQADIDWFDWLKKVKKMTETLVVKIIRMPIIKCVYAAVAIMTFLAITFVVPDFLPKTSASALVLWTIATLVLGAWVILSLGVHAGEGSNDGCSR